MNRNPRTTPRHPGERPRSAFRPRGGPRALCAAAALLALLWAAPALGEMRELYYPDKTLRTRVATIVTKQGDILRHGPFQRFHPNGRAAVQGAYRLDRPVGIWSWWNEEGYLMRRVRIDGDFEEILGGRKFNSPDTTFANTAGRTTAQGRMKFDKGHGQWRYWFDTGQPKAQGKFVTGVPDGRWVMLYPDGQIESIQEYRLGILHGLYMKAYPNGQEKVEGRMEHGMKVGLWRHWYEDGRRRTEGRYVNDLEDGKWRFWTKDGELASAVIYKAGQVERELPIARKPSGMPRAEPVIPLPDQKRYGYPGTYDPSGARIRHKRYTAPATGWSESFGAEKKRR